VQNDGDAEGMSEMTEQPEPVAYRSRRRALVRVAVPIAVVAAVGAGIGLVPALASDNGPSLPSVTAQQLVAKALGSDTRALSGTVQVKADLGVPTQLLGLVGGAAGSRQAGGADPTAKLTALLGGQHTLQVAVDGPDHQRIGLLEDLAGFELVHDGADVWAWDSSSNEAQHLKAPRDAAGKGAVRQPSGPLSGLPVTPQEAAGRFLAMSAGTTSVTVDGTTTVAGRSAYRLVVKPLQKGSTIGQVRIAVDAATGVPLSVQAMATAGGTALDVHFSSVSFARPAASAFVFTVPKGAKVTEHAADGARAGKGATAPEPAGAAPRTKVVGEGWTSVVEAALPAGGPVSGDRHGGGGGALGSLSMLKGFGKQVAGGTLISTRVLNVLVTDDGRVFAGAVTLPVLQSAAGVK
jgi:outer membrane lipoprotein-sorting protein